MPGNNHEDYSVRDRIEDALLCVGIGDVFGFIVGLFVPDDYISDEMLAHTTGALFFILGFAGLFSFILRKKDAEGTLSKCLAELDYLMVKGKLHLSEYIETRRNCIKKHASER